jgi:NAD(P)-dependent dehydrogenase (short-subunit alcohol dehydrogenase family)
MSIGVSGVRTTLVQELLALVQSERVVSFGRHDHDDIHIDFAGEFDVTAIPIDLDRYLFAAGYLVPRPLAEQTFAETAASFAINLTSVVRMCDYVLANNPRARIAVVGSESWRGSFDTSYFLAKVGINAYVEKKRLPHPQQQLVVVSPTIIIDSGMTERRDDIDTVMERARQSPRGDFLRAAEVARLIHYCLYVDTGNLTNTVISLNCGLFA